MSEHLDDAKRGLARAERGYTEDADWALVDVTKTLAQATVALAEAQRTTNQITYLALALSLGGEVPAMVGLRKDLFPDNPLADDTV